MAESVILDPATLQAFRNSLGADGADVFRTVLRLFLSDAPRLIAAMEKGLRETDLRLVQRRPIRCATTAPQSVPWSWPTAARRWKPAAGKATGATGRSRERQSRSCFPRS